MKLPAEEHLDSRQPVCRMCGSSDQLQSLGQLPDLQFFAGTKTDTVLKGGSLQRCLACESMQRYPVYSEATYTQLYVGGASDTWAGKSNRNDNKMIADFIAENPTIHSVLDVGCNVGELLSYLPHSIEKFGIEPSVAAKAIAAGKGIQIIGDTPADLSNNMMFDCIVAVDVIEHIVEPNSFMQKLCMHLKPGGVLILSTGNPQYSPWYKRFKTRFWYSSFPEHLSFPSGLHYHKWAKSNGMTLEQQMPFYYSSGRPLRMLVIFLLQYSFVISRGLHRVILWLVFGVLLKVKNAAERPFFLPCSGLFKDHHMCILRKPPLSIAKQDRS